MHGGAEAATVKAWAAFQLSSQLSLKAVQAIKVVNMIKIFGKPIRVNKASQEKRALDVGANLFIGNLDPDVDEKMLYDTFSAFGVIAGTPKIMRDPDSGVAISLAAEHVMGVHGTDPICRNHAAAKHTPGC